MNTTHSVRTAEGFGYDADGNLTNDGRWALTWDGENRLVSLVSLTTGPADSRRKLEFTYDWQGRRVEKKVSTWNGSAYIPQSTNRFVYDGWNLIATLDSQSSILRSFMWGLDLSGTMQGAGGVGGLLAVNNSVNGTHFVCYDGNGNVTALVKATDGTVSANYEYGPFGELLRATGLMAKTNPFRFSTKYLDDESDLLYYGYRSYNPNLGRWLSRDPIEEAREINLYTFVGNDGMNAHDLLGLCDLEYVSEGRSFRDPWYWSSWTSSDSGVQSSADASYQQGVEGWGNSGGICNTGQSTSHVGSFVEAFVSHRGFQCCCKKVRFKCSYTYFVSLYSPVKSFATAKLDGQGTLLDKPVKGFIATQPHPPSPGVSNAAFWTDTAEKTVDLAPNQWFKLYDIYPSVAGFQGIRGASFVEHMTATCSATILGPCGSNPAPPPF